MSPAQVLLRVGLIKTSRRRGFCPACRLFQTSDGPQEIAAPALIALAFLIVAAVAWVWTIMRMNSMNSMTSKKTRLPRMLRGSLVTLRRRCGKPGCHCAQGEQRHEAPALSYSERGRTRVVMLAESDVAAVAAALLRAAAQMIRERGLNVVIEVDGGIDSRTAPLVCAAGAEILVAGSAVFGQPDRQKAIETIRSAVSSIAI